MALIQLSFGRDRTGGETDDDTEVDRVEIPIDEEVDDDSGSGGRGLLGLLLLAAIVAGAGYLLYRRATAGGESEFAEIVFEDETPEAGAESTDE